MISNRNTNAVSLFNAYGTLMILRSTLLWYIINRGPFEHIEATIC